jgi:hypothetical protein
MSTTKLLYDEFLAASWIRLLFGAFWMALLLTGCASVVPIEEAVDIQNVPQDKGGVVDGRYDYNDLPFLPLADHRIQVYEWLGPGVSEENAPKPVDDFDDGLVVVNPSGFRQPGGVVDLAVNIRTSFAQNPRGFPNTFEGRLAIWIDWDYNRTFIAAENVYNQPIDLPFQVGNMTFSQALVLIPVTVPANFQPRLVMGPDPQKPGQQKVIGVENPPIRARVAYGRKPLVPINPGGSQPYGEVEDHADSQNELAFFSDDPAAPSALAALPPVLLVAFRDMLGKSLALMQSDLEGQIVLRRGIAVADLATLVAFVADAQSSVLPGRVPQ